MNKPWSESWFDAYAPERFEAFTPSHVWAVLGFIVCALLLFFSLMMLLFEVLPGGRLYARLGTYRKTY
jgi:hypothetical protein